MCACVCVCVCVGVCISNAKVGKVESCSRVNKMSNERSEDWVEDNGCDIFRGGEGMEITSLLVFR